MSSIFRYRLSYIRTCYGDARSGGGYCMITRLTARDVKSLKTYISVNNMGLASQGMSKVLRGLCPGRQWLRLVLK